MAYFSAQPDHPPVSEDVELAIKLQLEEIGNYSQNSKGKYVKGCPPDTEVAYKTLQDELSQHQTFIEDRKLAESIGAAVGSDGTAIARMTAQEIQSYEDRQLALETVNDNPEEYGSVPLPCSSTTDASLRGWLLTVAESQHAGPAIDFSDEEAEAGPSMSYAERQADTLDKLAQEFQCVCCRELLSSVLAITVPCGDKYCPDCLKRLFILATNDETRMPVRCHMQPIPLALISEHLSDLELDAFKLAELEFSTENRIYCSNRDCNRFVPPQRLHPGTNDASCEHCHHVTCGICKNGLHEGKKCPDDPTLQETRELAQRMGWMGCYRCGSLVDLRTGCNHITCRCGAEFCYVCGTQWKGCGCDLADADRMLERAEEIVDRNDQFALPAAERQHQVQEVHEELMGNHECQHVGRFRRVENVPRGGFQCELCGDRHWVFIMECRRCSIWLCQDCRCNRI